MADLLLLGVFPYVAVTLAVTVGVFRYYAFRYSYSSLSSQFLESRQLFWGSIPWHYGIVIILVGHLIGFLVPGAVKTYNGVPLRLYILEATALAFGILTLIGLVGLMIRRLSDPKVQVVTTPMDLIILVLLLLQVVAGVYTAVFYRWGSNWYLAAAVPYLWSLLKFSPQIDAVSSLPFMTKLHIINAWALVAVFPFSRLVHIIALPLSYLTRPNQVVRWNSPRPLRTDRPAAAARSSKGLEVSQ